MTYFCLNVFPPPNLIVFRKRSSKPEAAIESLLQWALSEEDLHILCIFKASPVYVLANTDACDIKALWHKYVKINDVLICRNSRAAPKLCLGQDSLLQNVC